MAAALLGNFASENDGDITKIIDNLFKNDKDDKITEYWTKFLQQPKAHENIVQYFVGYLKLPAKRYTEYKNPEKEPEKIVEFADQIIDQIGDAVTKRNKKKVKNQIFILDENGFLFKKGDQSKKYLISPKSQKMFIYLNNNYCRTNTLRGYSTYKNDESTRRAIQKLNHIGFSVFKLKTKMIIGQKTLGYKLFDCIKIRINKKNPYK